MLGIRKAKLDCTRLQWTTLAIVTIAEGTFNLLGCGFYVVDWRASLLFSDWFDN